MQNWYLFSMHAHNNFLHSQNPISNGVQSQEYIVLRLPGMWLLLGTGVLFVGNPVSSSQLAKNTNADLLAVNYQFIDKELVDDVHKHNLKIFVWNIDTIEDFECMLSLGVDGVGSNKPKKIW